MGDGRVNPSPSGPGGSEYETLSMGSTSTSSVLSRPPISRGCRGFRSSFTPKVSGTYTPRLGLLGLREVRVGGADSCVFPTDGPGALITGVSTCTGQGRPPGAPDPRVPGTRTMSDRSATPRPPPVRRGQTGVDPGPRDQCRTEGSRGVDPTTDD